MTDPDTQDEIEGQDLAEIFDETNITEDGDDIAVSDMERDVFDVTAAEDDADLDDARAADDDFDPASMDEAEYEEVVMADEDLDQPRPPAASDQDRVRRGDPSPKDFESKRLSDDDLEELGYQDSADDEDDAALDEALDETFPASDPIAIDRRGG